jgi:hypothetical protein
MGTYYYHVTLAANEKSIRLLGLCARFSRKKRQAVWLCDEIDLMRAIAHTAGKPWARGQQLLIVRADMDGAHLRKHPSGYYYYCGDVPAKLLTYRCLDLMGGYEK